MKIRLKAKNLNQQMEIDFLKYQNNNGLKQFLIYGLIPCFSGLFTSKYSLVNYSTKLF